MKVKDWLKQKLDIPNTWDKFDYEIGRYSFNDIEDVIEQYLDHIKEKDKRFAVGKSVKVIKCTSGHGFDIGQTVEIKSYEDDTPRSWFCHDGINSWWLQETEGEIL